MESEIEKCKEWMCLLELRLTRAQTTVQNLVAMPSLLQSHKVVSQFLSKYPGDSNSLNFPLSWWSLSRDVCAISISVLSLCLHLPIAGVLLTTLHVCVMLLRTKTRIALLLLEFHHMSSPQKNYQNSPVMNGKGFTMFHHLWENTRKPNLCTWCNISWMQERSATCWSPNSMRDWKAFSKVLTSRNRRDVTCDRRLSSLAGMANKEKKIIPT